MDIERIFKDILEWIICTLFALIIALSIRYYLVTPRQVMQTSMYDTLEETDRVLLNRYTKNYKVGDIITFEAPNDFEIPDLKNPIAIYDKTFNSNFDKFVYYVLELNKETYIKRIIALEGDRVQIKNGKVYVNGEELQEDYLSEDTITQERNFNDVIVPKGCIYVLGDNREKSEDSRYFGCIPLEKVEGKIILRYWPLNKFGKIE